MANKTILLWDTDSKKPKNAWWSTGISNFNSVINSNNNLPTNAVISKAVLKVYADFDGAGGLANVYMKYGFGGNESISTQLGGQRKLTGDETNYDTDITSYMSSKVSPFAISTAYGSYFSANIYTTNIVVSALRMGKVELYVEYSIPTYTVTWKNHDGTVLETDTGVAYGTTPTYNGSTPTKASTAQHAYTFSGWSPAISAVTGNVTYTAQFTATVRKYTVKWYNYDGTLLETDTEVPYGTKPTYNGATPTKPSDDYYNYGFAGWSPSINEGIQGDKNFTAQFAQTDRYYTVRWVNASAVQGVEGALLETDEVKFNTQPDYNGAIPKHPKQDTDPAFNYDFIGWSAKVTDPAKPDTELEKVKGDITYTAIYETTPKLYAITIILFNSQSTDIYEYGTELTIEAPEIVDFHRFVKWNDGDTRPSRTVQVTGEATYQAVYERISIPIKANLEQITGCYLIPDTNTIVYIINGTVPTVKIGRESVDGRSFLVSNSVPENGYPLKKLFITENSGVTTRVY